MLANIWGLSRIAKAVLIELLYGITRTCRRGGVCRVLVAKAIIRLFDA